MSRLGGIAHEKPTSVGSGPRKFLRFSSETASVVGREPIKKRPLFRGHPFQRGKVGRKSEATGVAPCGGRPTAMRDVENVEESDVAQSGCDLFGCNVNVHLRNQNGKPGWQAAPLPEPVQNQSFRVNGLGWRRTGKRPHCRWLNA